MLQVKMLIIILMKYIQINELQHVNRGANLEKFETIHITANLDFDIWSAVVTSFQKENTI